MRNNGIEKVVVYSEIWFWVKRLLAVTLFLSVFIAFLCAGCDVKPRDRGEYYNRYKLDVNCGEKFKGIVYEKGHSKASIYTILYELPNGNRIDLPLEGCVAIVLEEYQYTKSE